MIQVIGISGKAGSGKDYISHQYLAPLGFKQWSLAWHFKVWIVGKGLATHEETFVTKPPHIRNELQLEGTERGRMVYGDDVWCETAREWFTVLHEQWGIDKFVIPDVRFPNEVKFIRNMGGKVIRLHAPNRILNSSLTESARQHISETALDHFIPAQFDGIINNDPEYAHTVQDQLMHILAQ